MAKSICGFISFRNLLIKAHGCLYFYYLQIPVLKIQTYLSINAIIQG